MAIQMAVSADDFPEARECVSKVLGEKRLEEYQEIFPLLALVEYRVWLETDFDYIISRVQYGDELVPTGGSLLKNILHFFGGVFLFPVISLKTISRPLCSESSKKMLVFSNTFIKNERYPSSRKLLDNTCGYRVIFTMCDALQYGHGSIRQALINSLKGNYGNYRPIIMLASSVSGIKLKYYTKKWCEVIYKYKRNESTSDQDIDKILTGLQSAYLRRLNKVKKILGNSQIEMYTTVNQYNLRDVIIIHACKELGIRTAQMEHHVMQFSRINFSEEKPIWRYAFAQENYTWSETDKRFHEKVFLQDNILESHDKIKIKIMGNLEWTYDDAVQAIKKYSRERRITFMTSALTKIQMKTSEEVERVKKWRWKIFTELKSLSERQDVIIRIRYTPFREYEFREEEIPILQSWGFEISESLPQNLIEDICRSEGVMSTTSTVLATAMVFGRVTYRIEDPGVQYLHIDDRIMDIKVEDISSIIFPKIEEVDLCREDFFIPERLFEK